MANEYLVNSADLTSVANAIRTKGETSAQLVFPSGFVSAIENIKSGADLNFEVIGGTSKPSNPKENTIWVNTSTAITSWAFSADEPTAPVSGMVWIYITKDGTIGFNALSENQILLKVAHVRQYSGNKWLPMEGEVYQSGEWAGLWEGQLFDSGDVYEEITGGWTPCAMGTYPLLMTNSYITNVMRVYKTSSTSGDGAGYATANKINLEGYNSIEVTVSRVIANSVRFMLTEDRDNNPYKNNVAYLELDKVGVKTLNISGLTSTKLYIAVGEYSSAARDYGVEISKIELKE